MGKTTNLISRGWEAFRWNLSDRAAGFAVAACPALAAGIAQTLPGGDLHTAHRVPFLTDGYRCHRNRQLIDRRARRDSNSRPPGS
jgi:hypothetical protein